MLRNVLCIRIYEVTLSLLFASTSKSEAGRKTLAFLGTKIFDKFSNNMKDN